MGAKSSKAAATACPTPAAAAADTKLLGVRLIVDSPNHVSLQLVTPNLVKMALRVKGKRVAVKLTPCDPEEKDLYRDSVSSAGCAMRASRCI